MASNAGAVPWNNDVDDGEEGGDEESVGETASIDLPELSEGQELAHPNVPHLLNDFSDRTFSPRSKHLDLSRSQSMSSVGLGSINNVRVSQQCVSRSSLVESVVRSKPSSAYTLIHRLESGSRAHDSVVPWWLNEST